MGRAPRWTWRILLLALCFIGIAQARLPPHPERWAVQLQISGPIGPATADYVTRAMGGASEEGASFVLLQMDTPGGLDLAMRDIIRAILASPIPVVTFVAPNGARAASAGTYILYASHIAAMAPATNLGAATPVSIFPGGEEPGGPDKGNERHDKGAAPTGDAMSRKAVNDAVAYIRSLAELRGRNAEWGERAVREAASLRASDALRLKVIDLIAQDPGDLVRQLDGRRVKLQRGEVTLEAEGLALVKAEPDWRSRWLAVLTDPNVAYLLMLLGIYGLIFEFMNPGTVIPGVAGGICLLLALFAFQVLPINFAGVALILLGLALMVAEVFAPSFGALGIGGVTAFVIGSVILIDTDLPGFGISRGLIGAIALFGALLFLAVVSLAVKARRSRIVSGVEQLVGGEAVADEDFERAGRVRIHSELWRARSSAPVAKGDRLKVLRVDGLTLEVEPVAVEERAGGPGNRPAEPPSA